MDGVTQAPVQLAWMFVDSPPLQGRAPHENHDHENLRGKHLVDLIPRFPCAGSSAACNGAVHAESVRTELLLSDMGESQFVKAGSGTIGKILKGPSRAVWSSLYLLVEMSNEPPLKSI